MKQLCTFFVLGLFSIMSLNAQVNYTQDSVSMTPSYAKDVFYSMANGEVSTADRANWDVAFRALTTSASILINDASGVELYTWPGGAIADWANVDTAGISGWTPMYNSPTEWEEGAFTQNATGHPDYGWGIYNMATHNLTGDSVFVIKTLAGDYKKIAIVSKQSLAMVYTIQYASLDGSNDTTIAVDASNYSTKNFVYFDLSTHTEIDREPVKTDWDILFTKYNDEVAPGAYYPVTGVLHNFGVLASRYTEGDTSSLFWELDSLKPERNTIGWDWKSFNSTTFSYEVDDSMYFFVRDLNDDLYKLVFEGFDGSSTGNIYFRKALISAAGIAGDRIDDGISVYPNPATDQARLILPEGFTAGIITVYSNNGQKVMELEADNREVYINTGELAPGLYIVEVNSNIIRSVRKLMVR